MTRALASDQSILIPVSSNKKRRTHVYCCVRSGPREDCGGQWVAARNTEFSSPCGSQCAERNAISQYVSRMGGCALSEVTMLLLTSFVEGEGVEGWQNQYILPCGVCREELLKICGLKEDGSMIEIWCIGEWDVLRGEGLEGFAKGPLCPQRLLPGIRELLGIQTDRI